jgi:hypothetical protein
VTGISASTGSGMVATAGGGQHLARGGIDHGAVADKHRRNGFVSVGDRPQARRGFGVFPDVDLA